MKAKSDVTTIALHWGLVITLIISFITGMRIASDEIDASWARAIQAILPQGNIIHWHLLTALVFVGLVFAYVAFLWRAGALSRVALNSRWRRMLVEGDGRARWRAINTLLYWIGFLALGLALATGLLMNLFPAILPYALTSVVHQYAAWALPAYIVAHVGALAIFGGLSHLLKLFRPRLAYGMASVFAMTAGVAAAAVLFGLETTVPGDALRAARLDEAPVLDGKSDDAAWTSAESVTVMTSRGVNAPGGEIPVTIRTAHDGEFFYGLFEWEDTTRSQKHLPLVKTADGWKVQQFEYGIQDEDDYYEDKFGVMLSDVGRVAGNHSIHLGPTPLEGKPGPSGGRGLHYTTDGSIVDVWHWKSVRTGNDVMNQIDDNYFGPPMEPKEGARYTGGYSKDPKDEGGYEMNWESYSDAGVTPKYLPSRPELLEPFQDVNLEPSVGDDVALFLNKSDVVPYDPALDTYPVGTIMPAVVVSSAMTGDRGDVTAVSTWADGMWTMEVKRKLDTGSEFDVAFRAGRPTYLWVAAFNHAQTRHSRHLYPVSISLE